MQGISLLFYNAMRQVGRSCLFISAFYPIPSALKACPCLPSTFERTSFTKYLDHDADRCIKSESALNRTKSYSDEISRTGFCEPNCPFVAACHSTTVHRRDKLPDDN